jgi:hypothetical protein
LASRGFFVPSETLRYWVERGRSEWYERVQQELLPQLEREVLDELRQLPVVSFDDDPLKAYKVEARGKWIKQSSAGSTRSRR